MVVENKIIEEKPVNPMIVQLTSLAKIANSKYMSNDVKRFSEKFNETGCAKFVDNAYKYVMRTIRNDMNSFMSHQEPTLKILSVYTNCVFIVQ